MDKQSELIERLMKILQKKPMSILALSKDIGVGFMCFHTFWNRKRVTSLKILLIIENYVSKHENL